MSTIITPNIAYFKEGEVYVYTLPEKKKPTCLGKGFCCADRRCDSLAWEEAVSYARAHTFKVDEKSLPKLKNLIWHLNKFQKPRDLTEYRIEGTKFEIRRQYCSRVECCNEPNGCHYIPCKEESVACLIEDAGVKEEQKEETNKCPFCEYSYSGLIELKIHLVKDCENYQNILFEL